MNSPESQVRHWPFLDGIRGLGMLLVIGIHIGAPQVPGGFLGLDLFFVLSGFLITFLLLDEWNRSGTISLKNFYMRRALRLLPVLFVVLIATCTYAWFFLDRNVARGLIKTALYASIYVENWAWALYWVEQTALTHTWSLSVEEQFYILWPILLLALLRLPVARRWKLMVVAIGFLSSAAWRIYLIETAPNLRAFIGIDTRADGILMGCFVGMLIFWDVVPKRRWIRRLVAVAGAAAAAVLAWWVVRPDMVRYYSVGLLELAVAGAVLMFSLFYAPPPLLRGALELRPLTWLGRRSYSIYLWHLPLFVLPLPVFGAPVTFVPGMRAEATARIVVALIFGIVSYTFIERPFLRLKKRFSAQRTTRERPPDTAASPAVPAVDYAG